MEDSGCSSDSENAECTELPLILKKLISPQNNTREDGLRKLKDYYGEWDESEKCRAEKIKLQGVIISKLDPSEEELLEGAAGPPDGDLPRDIKRGYLIAALHLIPNLSPEEDEEFLNNLRSVCLKFIQDEEECVVRMAAGAVLGELCACLGVRIYEACREVLVELISKATQADLEWAAAETDRGVLSPEQGFDISTPSHILKEKFEQEERQKEEMEPSLKTLRTMVESLRSDFKDFVDEYFLQIICLTLKHSNRHIRESGLYIITTLIYWTPAEVLEFGMLVVEAIRTGLSDYWNQVRMAALATVKEFFSRYSRYREPFLPLLLPGLCFNRYYSAEGVRKYAQEVWQPVVGLEGRHLVGIYISNFVTYYVKAAKSENIAERTTVGPCIAELASKIPQTRPHVDPLLQVLITLSDDEVWSVRDGAGLAFGAFMKKYPEETRSHLNNIYEILFRNLENSVRVVREGAATALVDAIVGYGNEAKTIVLDKLKSVKVEERVGKKFGYCNCSKCASGVGYGIGGPGDMRERPSPSSGSDSESNTKPIYSPTHNCPWELVDGCLYLISCMAELESLQKEVIGLVPFILKAGNARHFEEQYSIIDTICNVLPLVAKGIGKPCCKQYLEEFFDIIFFVVDLPTLRWTPGAADNCLIILSQFIGPTIFKARLEKYDSTHVYINYLERILTTPSSSDPSGVSIAVHNI